MSRNAFIAIFLSLLLHAGVAFSGYLMPEEDAVVIEADETPTIALDLPPPPEPEEPELVDNVVSDAPAEVAELAPPMQNDLPSAVIDSAFVQQIQAPPPPDLNRSAAGIIIPTNTRPVVAAKPMANLFDLAALDKKPVPTFQAMPQHPVELKRAGIEGEVHVRFIVDAQGNVREPTIVRSSNPAFDEAVFAALAKWKFRPGEKGGAKVNTRNVQIVIPFTLKTDR